MPTTIKKLYVLEAYVKLFSIRTIWFREKLMQTRHQLDFDQTGYNNIEPNEL